jgi:hypothetical protein
MNLKKILKNRNLNIENRLSKAMAVAGFVGVILTVCSCYFSGMLFEKFAESGGGRLVWWAVAISLQISLSVLAFVTGYNIYKGAKYAVPLSMAIFLFGLSMVCSLGAMSEGSDTRVKQVNSISDQTATIQNRISQIDQDQTWLKKEMDRFAARSQLSKGYLPSQERLNRLTAERDNLTEKLLYLQRTKTTDGNALFRSLSNLFGGNPDNLKDHVHFAISFGIDATAIILLLVSGGFVGMSGQDDDRIGQGRIGQDATGYRIPDQDFAGAAAIGFISPEPVPLAGQDVPTGTGTGRGQVPSQDVCHNFPTGTGRSQDVMSGYIANLFPKKPNQDGSLVGRARVAKILGISDVQARDCHLKLKKAGLINVKGSKTYPVVSQAKMLEKMEGGTAA